MSLTVLKAGLLSSLQDRGRHGWAGLGVGPSGAMDEVALRLANALVGNDASATALEISLLGPRLRFERDTLIAVTGAEFQLRLDAQPLAMWQAQRVAAGTVLDCGRAHRGTRGYLAVASGFAAERLLGSAATDLNAQLGPFAGRALRVGDALPIATSPPRPTAPRPHAAAPTRHWSLDPRPWFDPNPSHPIRLIRGTHFDALDAASQEALFAAEFRISIDSNRVGFRLDGPRLRLRTALEPISAPVAFGTLQLPAGGQPIALMAEHPTTGGYPRIGQIAAIDLPRLAQHPPGARLRFQPIALDQAQALYLAREQALTRLIERIARRPLPLSPGGFTAWGEGWGEGA